MTKEGHRRLPSEAGNPDLGWWDHDGSSDPSGHQSVCEYTELLCPHCGGQVDAEVYEQFKSNRMASGMRCPDCGRRTRFSNCGQAEMISTGMIDPAEVFE